VEKAADHKGNADIFGIIDDPSLYVVGERKLHAADELAIQEKEVRLVQIAKLSSYVVPLVIADLGQVGARPTAGVRAGIEEATGIVVGVSAAQGTHKAGDRD